MFVTGKTDIGKFREENQDRFRISMPDDDTIIAIVCDGMGGAAAGGLAGEMAAGAVFERLELSFRPGMEPKSIKALLLSAVAAANTLIYNKAGEIPENHGMGTTCVAAIIHNGLMSVVNVGDSRAYIMNEAGITQVTTDHTMVEYLRSKGLIEESEMKVHHMRNVITRAVGVDETVEPDYFEVEVKPGDYVLFCTDGLTGYINDELIYSTTYKRPLETAVSELVDRVNALNGKDNITAVLAVI